MAATAAVLALGGLDCEAAHALSTLAGAVQAAEVCVKDLKRKRSGGVLPSTISSSERQAATLRGSKSRQGPGYDSSHSNASTDEKHENDSDDSRSNDHSDSDEYEFCDEEVEAASSLATIFHAAINSKVSSHDAECLDALTNLAKGRRKNRSSSTSNSFTDLGTDQTVIKKLRRREKNRASAQQSRQRKKCHLETLECRVHELEQEKAALASRVKELAADNAALRAKLAAAAAAAPRTS